MRDPRDCRAQGDPDTVVLLPHGALVGLYIKGLKRLTMLGIREDTEGRPVSCAITNELPILPLHSNPHRVADEDGG